MSIETHNQNSFTINVSYRFNIEGKEIVFDSFYTEFK